MKTLYFDCASGISGNMVLGALLEIIGDENFLRAELAKLNLDGYQLKISRKDSHGISATHVEVIVDGKDEYGHVHHLDHSQSHHHHHRHLHDIYQIIDGSALTPEVKALAKDIFKKVALAESKVHGQPLEKVHFHEVGAIDSIIDIVGTAILIDKIHPDQILSSVITEGTGFIECAHGTMSVPVPATTEIFASHHVKFKQTSVETELVTPTGAAIIATLAENYQLIPEMSVKKVGSGAGTKDIGYPNILKVYLGETAPVSSNPRSSTHPDPTKDVHPDQIYLLATNLDDSTGEQLGYCLEKLMQNGALDAFFTPIFMKKNRPAYKLEVICRQADLNPLAEIIFDETTAIGVRFYPVDRIELPREQATIATEYGEITAKKVQTPSGKTYIYPEYESVKSLAKAQNLPLKAFYHRGD